MSQKNRGREQRVVKEDIDQSKGLQYSVGTH